MSLGPGGLFSSIHVAAALSLPIIGYPVIFEELCNLSNVFVMCEEL